MAEKWSRQPKRSVSVINPESRYQPKQKPGLAEILGEAGVDALIAKFRGRSATKQELADECGYSLSSIERLLRVRGVRRWTVSAQPVRPS
jgi:hypothetical protein